MSPNFQQLDKADVQLAMASGGSLQLHRQTKFPQSGVTSLEGDDLNKYFEKGQNTSIRRVRASGSAQDYDPRSGTAADSTEPGYIILNLELERLFTKGYPVYSMDANLLTYVQDYLDSNINDIGTSQDDYLYQKCFRDWSGLASTGAVRIGGHPGLQVVFEETSGGALADFNDHHLLAADKVLFSNNVPSAGRYARLSPTARQTFLKDVTLVSGFAGSMSPQQPGAALLNSGMMEQEVMRRDFMTCGSNAVTGQSVVADLGDGTATDAISAVVADTTVFFADDKTGSVPLGAVRLTLGVTAALNVGIAVGKIARLGPDAGPATAYGVILRVDAANKYVWLVPFNKSGDKLTAAQISTSTDKFGIPAIGSVNTAHHREHLVYASRLLTPPSPGSGAVSTIGRAPNSSMLLQIFSGSYDINYLREGVRTVSLMGAMPSDYRKAVLMLSA